MDNFGIQRNMVGGLLKYGTHHWNIPNVGATNVLGFDAHGNGACSSTGSFSEFKDAGYYWVFDPVSPSTPNYAKLSSIDSDLTFGVGDNNNGFSIRCVKD